MPRVNPRRSPCTRSLASARKYSAARVRAATGNGCGWTLGQRLLRGVNRPWRGCGRHGRTLQAKSLGVKRYSSRGTRLGSGHRWCLWHDGCRWHYRGWWHDWWRRHGWRWRHDRCRRHHWRGGHDRRWWTDRGRYGRGIGRRTGQDRATVGEPWISRCAREARIHIWASAPRRRRGLRVNRAVRKSRFARHRGAARRHREGGGRVAGETATTGQGKSGEDNFVFDFHGWNFPGRWIAPDLDVPSLSARGKYYHGAFTPSGAAAGANVIRCF